MQDLLDTVLKIAPFALAGVVVPSWTKYVAILLGTRRPVRNASAFVLGNASFRLALGVVVIWIHQVSVVKQTGSSAFTPAPIWLIAPGLALLGFALRLWFVPPSSENERPRWLQALESIKPWMAFWTGFAMVAAPGIQWVYFLSGAAVLADAPLNTAETFIALVLFVLFLELMLLTPIVLYVASGDRAVTLVARFKAWIVANEHRVAAVVLAVFGGFMIYAGVVRL